MVNIYTSVLVLRLTMLLEPSLRHLKAEAMKQWKVKDDGFTGQPVRFREVCGSKNGEQSDPRRIRRFFYSSFL